MKISTILGAALADVISVEASGGSVYATTPQHEAVLFADDTSVNFRFGPRGGVSFIRVHLSTTGGGNNKHNLLHWRLGRLTLSCMTAAGTRRNNEDIEQFQAAFRARRKAA